MGEEGGMTKISGTSKSASKQKKYEVKTEDVPVYNTSMDSTIGKKRKAMEDSDEKEESVKKVKVEKVEEATEEVAPKKKKKKLIEEVKEEPTIETEEKPK